MDSSVDRLAAEAANPATAPARLHELAANHPDLHPLIASNPATYEELLDWLRGVDDPFTRAVVEARDRGLEGEEAYNDAIEATSPSRADSGDAEATTLLAPAAASESTRVIETPRNEGSVSGQAPARRSLLTGQVDEPRTPTQGVEQVRQAPAYVPARAAAAAAEEDTEPRRTGISWTVVLLLVLLVIALIAASVFGYLLLGGGQSSGDRTVESSTSTVAPTHSETTTPTPTPSETETPFEEQTRFPAPEGAVGARNFALPSGNINCQIDDDNVRCTIKDKNFGECGDELFTVRLDLNGAQPACGDAGGAAVTQGRDGVLVYDTSSTASRYACTSTTAGISCWDTITGTTFDLARQGWSTHQK